MGDGVGFSWHRPELQVQPDSPCVWSWNDGVPQAGLPVGETSSGFALHLVQ